MVWDPLLNVDPDCDPSVAHYVLVEQVKPRAYVYSRRGAGDFGVDPVQVRGIDGVIELPALGLRLPMALAYAVAGHVCRRSPSG